MKRMVKNMMRVMMVMVMSMAFTNAMAQGRGRGNDARYQNSQRSGQREMVMNNRGGMEMRGGRGGNMQMHNDRGMGMQSGRGRDMHRPDNRRPQGGFAHGAPAPHHRPAPAPHHHAGRPVPPPPGHRWHGYVHCMDDGRWAYYRDNRWYYYNDYIDPDYYFAHPVGHFHTHCHRVGPVGAALIGTAVVAGLISAMVY